jgi:hypothetical protein
MCHWTAEIAVFEQGNRDPNAITMRSRGYSDERQKDRQPWKEDSMFLLQISPRRRRRFMNKVKHPVQEEHQLQGNLANGCAVRVKRGQVTQ